MCIRRAYEASIGPGVPSASPACWCAQTLVLQHAAVALVSARVQLAVYVAATSALLLPLPLSIAVLAGTSSCSCKNMH
jgi:hypothetical protein